MNTAIKHAASLTAAALLALTPACIAPDANSNTTQEVASVVGTWEGADKKGVYTLKFTGTEWEVRIEKGGISFPLFRGTYTQSGARVDLQMLEEIDNQTMKWTPLTGIDMQQANLVGRLTGSKLKIAALTEADLVRLQ